jgi:hypothetical protein
MKIKSGVKRDLLLSEYKLRSYSHLTEIMKKEEKIIEKYQSISNKTSVKTFALKEAKHPELEKALILWMRQMRTSRMNLTADLILKKAEKFAKDLGFDFKPTNGYLKGLKQRNGILFAKQYGESVSVDNTIVENWSTKLKDDLKGYRPQDVYNLDETALFYRLLPSKTYVFSDEKRFGDKKFKDRITLVLITNADGSDRSCAMIGKSGKPLALRGKVLKIDYYSQKNAWIDSTIYKKIVVKLNEKMRRNGRKILLYVDNCRTHTLDFDLSNVSIKYIPANTTSVLQVK